MSLPLETAESPFKNKNSLGQVLVDGNQLDISNINCYLQLLAQTANKKEKLRRKRRRERREKRKGNSSSSSKERRRSKKEREGKEKEIEPDVSSAADLHIKTEPLGTSTDQHGLTVAPTLPSQSVHPNGAMGRRAASSPVTPTPVSASDLAFDHAQPPHVSYAPPSRNSSWSQFIIEHAQHQDFASGYSGAPSSHLMSNQQQFIQHRSSPAALYNNVGQPYTQLHPQQQQFDPAAEFIQFMTEHQSCSNPSFTFSSSFSSDALSPITDESFMGFPLVPSAPSPYLAQHIATTSGFTVMPPSADLMQAQVQMHQPQQSAAFYPDFAGLLTSSASSSFGMEPIDDRDGTFASLEFLEAALAQDMPDA